MCQPIQKPARKKYKSQPKEILENRSGKEFLIQLGKIQIKGCDDRIFQICIGFLLISLPLLILGLLANFKISSIWAFFKDLF